MFENIKIDVSYFLLHNVYTHDTHRERVDTYMATCYIYTYHKMTTCVFAQTSLHMLYAKINLENSQLSKQHVKTTLQYAANSFHKTWRFPEAVISILFQHRRWGQGHRLSGSIGLGIGLNNKTGGRHEVWVGQVFVVKILDRPALPTLEWKLVRVNSQRVCQNVCVGFVLFVLF